MPTSDADAYMKAQSCRVCLASDKAVKALEYARGLLSEERRLQRAHLLKRPRQTLVQWRLALMRLSAVAYRCILFHTKDAM